MRKLFNWISRIIICVFLLFIIAGVIAYLINKSYEKPSPENAPWAIQTYSNDIYRVPSRVYYACNVTITDGTPVITNYWSFDGEKYHKIKAEKSFPPDLYGEIEISRRVIE